MMFNVFGIRLTIAVCLSLQMSGVVEASGTCELKMNNYQNPSERLADGSSCDQWWVGECDPIFTFSLDQASGSTTNPQSYYYWTMKTGTYQDKNDVIFGPNMNGLNNPIIWNFVTWPGSVLFKVYIEDDDEPYTRNDYEDGMVQNLSLTPAGSKATASETTITIYGLRANYKTTLSMTYKCYCDDGYTGSNCGTQIGK